MELKEFEVGLGQMFEDGSPVVIAVDENNNPRLLGNEKVYLKSEADKVIAKLKEIDSQNRSAYYKDLAMMAKDVEHHKYKRCLAMARWCESENYTACWYHENSERCKWTEKWHKRWLKLAEKFKEAK